MEDPDKYVECTLKRCVRADLCAIFRRKIVTLIKTNNVCHMDFISNLEV